MRLVAERRRLGDAYDVQPRREIRASQTKRLTQYSPDTISRHGVAETLADAQPEPGPIQRIGGHVDNQHFVPGGTPRVVDTRVVVTPAESHFDRAGMC